MNPPQYSIDEMFENVYQLKQAWFYKGNMDSHLYFNQAVYTITNTNIPFPETELLGSISGHTFVSVNKTFIATIATIVENSVDAIAIQCIDGAVIITKEFSGDKDKIEGYWYSEYTPEYPYPVPNVLSEQEAKEIFKLIKIKESTAGEIYTRGTSVSRLDDTYVGSSEFQNEDWLWPEGFAEHYVLKYKVKPSDAFLKFIGWL